MKSRAAILAAVTAFIVAGCGLFETREPEDPLPPPPRHTPSAPESVLYNFEQGLEFKVVGASQLSEALGPNFILLIDPPDQDDLNGLEAVPKPDFEKANRDFLSLRVGGNFLDMDFRDDLVPPRPEGPDSAFYDDLP